jgi:hypothetical protein
VTVLRKIVDEKDARACLRAAARSGEERRSWARSHGIDGRSLRAWEIKLAMRSTEGSRKSSRELVELVPSRRTPRRHAGSRQRLDDGA